MVVTDKKKRRIIWAMLILYVCVLFYFLFFAEGLGRTTGGQEYRINLTLFQEIRRYIVHWNHLGWRIAGLNLIGNIICFVPIGFAVPLLGKKEPKIYKAFLVAFFMSTCVELTQLIFKIGSCDVDDVILNTLGGLLGYAVFRIFYHFRKETSPQ